MLAAVGGISEEKAIAGRRGPRCLGGVVLLVALCLALPGLAQAASTFYARGGGGNTTAPCTQAEPCNLAKAVNQAEAAGAGSAVTLLQGPTFTPGVTLYLEAAISVGGEPGAPLPTIEGPAEHTTLVVRAAGASLHDTRVIGREPGSSTLVAWDGTTEERVVVESDAQANTPCDVETAILVDSICRSGAGKALLLPAGNDVATLRNVTAVGATGGIEIQAPEGLGENLIEATNVIAYAVSGADVALGGVGPGGARIVLRHSDYDSVSGTTERRIATLPGADGNITAPPQFVNLAANDFHQLATSPTVDAGVNEAADGEFDLDHGPRALNGHPTCGASAAGPTDIGAYELAVPIPGCLTGPPPPASTPPPPPGTKLKKAKIEPTKLTATFTFAGTGALTGFRCELVRPAPKPAAGKGRKPKKPTFTGCRSPRTYKRLKPGRYTFKVEAIGPGGTDPSPAVRHFKIG
jgi:hypothetical protein